MTASLTASFSVWAHFPWYGDVVKLSWALNMGHWDPRVTPGSVSDQEHWNLPVYLRRGRGVMWGLSSAQAHPGAQVALGAELRGWGSAAQVLAELAPRLRQGAHTALPHPHSPLLLWALWGWESHDRWWVLGQFP